MGYLWDMALRVERIAAGMFNIPSRRRATVL